MDGNGGDPLSEDVAALREMAWRLAMPLDPYEDVAEVGILAGRLPEDLPVRPPIPDGSTVVGSVIRSLSKGRRSVEVLLDDPRPAGQFREDYRRQLHSDEWREEDGLPHGGFNPRGLPLIFRAAYRFPRLRRALGMDRKDFPAPFRLGAAGPRLTIMAQDRHDAPTDVRLHLILGHRDPWLRDDDAWTAVPTLYPPPDVRGRPEVQRAGVLHPPRDAERVGGGGGGWEPDAAYSHVVIETNAGLEALVAHYATQLEEAGWFRREEGLDGHQAWTDWTFIHEQEPWAGTFSALSLAGRAGRYSLQIHAARTPNH